MEDEASDLLESKTLGNLRVVDLKQELEKRGLSKSGSKKDLVKRLKQQLEFEKLCDERKSTGDCELKLELDAVTEQNEFVQQYLAQQQKIYAEQKEVKRLVELQESQQSGDERGSASLKESDASSDQDTESEEIENKSEDDKERSNVCSPTINDNKICDNIEASGVEIVNESTEITSTSTADEKEHCDNVSFKLKISKKEEFCAVTVCDNEVSSNVGYRPLAEISKENEIFSCSVSNEPGISDDDSSVSVSNIAKKTLTFHKKPDKKIMVKDGEEIYSSVIDQEQKNVVISINISNLELGNSDNFRMATSEDNIQIDSNNEMSMEENDCSESKVGIKVDINSPSKEEVSEDGIERNVLSSSVTENIECLKSYENLSKGNPLTPVGTSEIAESVELNSTLNMDSSNQYPSVPYSLADIQLPESPSDAVKTGSKIVHEDAPPGIHPVNVSSENQPNGTGSNSGDESSDSVSKSTFNGESKQKSKDIVTGSGDEHETNVPCGVTKDDSLLETDSLSIKDGKGMKQKDKPTRDKEGKPNRDKEDKPNRDKEDKPIREWEDKPNRERGDKPSRTKERKSSREEDRQLSREKDKRTSKERDNRTSREKSSKIRDKDDRSSRERDYKMSKEKNDRSSRAKDYRMSKEKEYRTSSDRSSREKDHSMVKEKNRLSKLKNDPSPKDKDHKKLKQQDDRLSDEMEEGERKSETESESSDSSDSNLNQHRGKGRQKKRDRSKSSESSRSKNSNNSRSPKRFEHVVKMDLETSSVDKKIVDTSASIREVPKEVAKHRPKLKRNNVVISSKKTTSDKHGGKESSRKGEGSDEISPFSAASVQSKKVEDKEPSPPPYVSKRKIVLSSRKIVEKSDEEPKTKKSKWGNISKSQKPNQTISISTDSLKDWFPDLKLLKNPDPSEMICDEPPTPVKEDSIPDPLPEKMDADAESSKVREEESGVTSNVLFIQNLVRPFTLLQLKELLQETGNLADFWIDKIKSKCFVTYEAEEEAVRTRNALNGKRWPSSNPKILSVEFSTEEELNFHKNGGDMPKPLLPALPAETIERSDHKRKEEERRRPVREWDKNKLTQESPVRESKNPEKTKVSDKREKKEGKRRSAEDTPAKLLDDLFQKTKSSPCIYWLPLTEQQVVQREESLRLRRQERERRNQAAEETEEKGKKAQPSRRTRDVENRRSSTRSRSPVSRRR